MAATDQYLELLEVLAFALPQSSKDDIEHISQHWQFTPETVRQLVLSESSEFAAISELARQNIEEAPKKIAFSALDYTLDGKSQPTNLIDNAAIVGFYAHPFISAQHIFTNRYALMSLSAKLTHAFIPQELCQLNFPNLLSYKQLQWFEQMGLAVNKLDHIVPVEVFLFLKQKGYISDSYLTQQHMQFADPFSLGIGALFDLPNDDSATVIFFDEEDGDNQHIMTQNRIAHHRKAEIFNALLDFLSREPQADNKDTVRTTTNKTLFGLEKKANLSLLCKLEQFRAFACLQAAQQSIHMVHEPYGIYRGVSQLRGLQPYFYLSLDQAGFAVAERLVKMGYTPHPKLLPAFINTLNTLKADNRLSAYTTNNFQHVSGVLGNIAQQSTQIAQHLVIHHTKR